MRALMHRHRLALHDPTQPDERGFVLVWAGFFLIVVLIMAGFSVDLGAWYLTSQRVQRAADAAALTGATRLPGFPAEACALAKQAADRNLPDLTAANFDCMVDPANPRRLIVTVKNIQNQKYFTSVLPGNFSPPVMARGSAAEYSRPIPLGSPENFIGYGDGNYPGYNRGNWAAVSGFCTAGEEGDERQANFDGNLPASGFYTNGTSTSSPGSCKAGTASPARGDDVSPFFGYNLGTLQSDPGGGRFGYDASGYKYTIDTSNSGSSVTLWLFDPYFTPEVGKLKPTYPLCNKAVATVISDVCVSKDRAGSYGAQRLCALPYPLVDALGPTQCPNPTSAITTTYSVTDSAGAPVSGCSKSYGTLTPSLANGVTAMEWLKLGQSIPGGVGGCTLPSGGVFNLQVTTDQAYTSNNFKSFGSNTFAILAEPGSAPPDGSPCSTISDTTCPSVYGQDAMSLLVADSGASASACGDGSANCAEFYLAQIPPAAAGQPLTISLWDAGDTFATSGANIQIIQPNGQIVDVFKYWADGLHPSTKPGANNQDSCSGRGCVNVSAVTPPYTAGQQFGRRGVGKFSDSMLFIEIPIPGSYATDASQASGWFKIRYHFPAGVTIADRTTWHVSVNANPVHLVR